MDIRKCNKRSHGKRKNRNLKQRNRHSLSSLSDLSNTLKQSGRHIDFLAKLHFLSLHFVIWLLRLINSMIEHIDFLMQQFSQGNILNMLFDLILTQKLNIFGILSKFNLSIKELNSLTYQVYLKINL